VITNRQSTTKMIIMTITITRENSKTKMMMKQIANNLNHRIMMIQTIKMLICRFHNYSHSLAK